MRTERRAGIICPCHATQTDLTTYCMSTSAAIEWTMALAIFLGSTEKLHGPTPDRSLSPHNLPPRSNPGP